MSPQEKIRAVEDFSKSAIGAELRQTQLQQHNCAVIAILSNPLRSVDDLISLVNQVGQLKQTQTDLFSETIERLKLETKPNE